MAKIFVNGINAKSAGGKSILTNFLAAVSNVEVSHSFVVLTPSENDYAQFQSDNVEIVSAGRLSAQLAFPFVNSFCLPRLIRELQCDLVFNLSDIPIPTKAIQVFLFDWPYAAYPSSPAWGLLDAAGWLVRKAKLFLFCRYLKYVDLLTTQNDAIKSRLLSLYDVRAIATIPNAVSLDHYAAEVSRSFDLGLNFKFLCLSHYYPHKNLEIFIPVAEKIREDGLSAKIIITISSSQSPGAASLLREIENRQLSDIIINIGPIPMSDIPALFAQTDALLLPTLLESFSGTYLEAMFHKKPILTSDLEFATGVCGDAATYFDPLDAESVFNAMQEVIGNQQLRRAKVAKGTEILDKMPTWPEACQMYLAVFDEQLKIKDLGPSPMEEQYG